MYLHAYSKSGIQIATNEPLIFFFLAFAIKISGGVAKLRPAFAVEIEKD